jgi:outer membrane protein assembly factor BamB
MTFRRLPTFKFSVTTLCVCAALYGAPPATADSGPQWSQFLASPAHDSYVADPAIGTKNARKLGVMFMANLFSADLGSPVVAYNATLQKEIVYVGDERGDLYALDAVTGQIYWSINLGFGVALRDTPAVDPNGDVWVGTTFTSRLYKLSGATGKVLCTIASPDQKPLWGSPMIVAPQGGSTAVYWDSVDNGGKNPIGPVVASNVTSCAQIFEKPVASGAWTTPAYALNGAGEPLVLVGTADPASTEYAFDALTGKLVWTHKMTTYLNDDIGAAATVSAPGLNGFKDGVAYVVVEGGLLDALDLVTGKPLWTHETYPNNYNGKQYVISTPALDGNRLAYGYYGGFATLDATTGNAIWTYTSPTGVDSSPAIIGPKGTEVVAFGDLAGVVRVFSLYGGSQLYGYQTGGYITASPAEYDGVFYITSSDGFLYAFTPNGGNGAPPAETIAVPSNGSTVPNPDGNLAISGTASDAASVSAVEIAVQRNGASGSWYDSATNTWNRAPYRNEATLSNPGAKSTTWSFALPVPAAGGSYEVFANAVNGAHIVDKGSVSYFTVQPSKNEPTVHASTSDPAPGSTFEASGNAFEPGETVFMTLLGSQVAKAAADQSGYVPPTRVAVPANAPFGPTSLTLAGRKSHKSASASVIVTNEWRQFGYNALRTAQEPHDTVIAHTIFVGGSLLNIFWTYASGAPINTSPAIVNGIAYIGNDGGILSAVRTATGSPDWTYAIASKAAIRSSAALDPSGQVIFGADDGNVYVLNSSGQLVTTFSLGGNLGAPAYAAGIVVIASSSGEVYSLTDPGFATRWSVNAGAAVTTAPVFDASAGLVIVGTSSGSVLAYSSATGAAVWAHTTGGAIDGLAVANGQVFAGSADGYVYAYGEKSGASRWKLHGDGTAVNALDINGAGPSFGTAGGNLYDVDAKGKVYYTPSKPYTNGPIAGVGGAGTDEFFSTTHGFLELLRIFDGSWQFGSRSTFGTGVGPVIVDGILYAGANDGNLYAFTPEGYSPPPQDTVRRFGQR